MAVTIGSARIDENGHAYGGKAGDQTGNECSTQSWYKHSKGWRVLRAIDPAVRKRLAASMKAACANNHIGYDQYERNSLYTEAAKVGFDVSKVTKNVETDCSALVRVCIAYAAGITSLPSSMRTTNMCELILKTGAFIELKGSKYTDQSSYLAAGDILCTKTQGHTVIVLTDGSKAETMLPDVKAYALGDRELRNGSTGPDVKTLQTYLIDLGYSCGSYGADSDYGDCTEMAVEQFQKSYGLTVDGIFGKASFAKLMDVMTALKPNETGHKVKISGGNCYLRSQPSTSGVKLAVLYNGRIYDYSESQADGWIGVNLNGTKGYASGKYASLEG